MTMKVSPATSPREATAAEQHKKKSRNEEFFNIEEKNLSQAFA
jgi:hypothetical protein